VTLVDLPDLATASWATVGRLRSARRFDVGVPVRISIGTPKWITGAEHFPAVTELMPWGLMKLTGDEFDERYVARLDRVGPDRIADRLRSIGRDYGTTLLLTCWEADPLGCHRSTAARWLEDRLDADVPEIAL
jgi:hypothetical protein